MDGVEASFGIWMQDFRSWDPSFEERGEHIPSSACPLTAACECLVPQSIDTLTEGAQLPKVARHCVIAVIADDDFAKPCTSLGRAIMHTVTKLSLDGFQLRCHSRFRRNASDGEGSGLVASPTVVSEAQEVERLRFSLSPQLAIANGVAPELDQPGLLRMEFQAELRQPLLELFKESHLSLIHISEPT